MEEKAAVLLKVCAGDGLAAGAIGIEGRRPENNVLAIEGAVALANGHGGLVRVEPHCSEAIAFGIEAGDSGASALGSIRIEEGEIRLQKLTVLNHVLPAGAFRDDGLAGSGEERFDHIPVAHKLREQLLTGTRCVRRLILIVGLLGQCRCGDE